MLILAFESSGKAASVALMKDGIPEGELFRCDDVVHSESLLPMAEQLLEQYHTPMEDVDLFAVASGPGSFTGIRIGIATVKGLSWALEKNCIGISTCEAMAYACRDLGGLICTVQDARRGQVYNAVFDVTGGTVTRLRPDRAVSVEELAEDLKTLPGPVTLTGDGTMLTAEILKSLGVEYHMPPQDRMFPHAIGVAAAAFGKEGYPSQDLLPVYLRLSQAERERQNRLNKNNFKEITTMGNVHVYDHPLIQHKLSILRDKKTSVKEFRELISEIARLMCYEATRDLPLEDVEVETPVAVAKCKHIAGKKLAVVPILRAGLGLVDGIVSMIPNAKVGHIGLFRDPQTLKPVKYYYKMPADITERDVIVVDPMLATGGSASAAIQFLKDDGVKHIKLMSVIAAPEGVERMKKDHPDVDIFVAAMDEKLNDHGYIVPGLGDAGDRIFGTK